jgi:uncharacterized protein YfaS (alpha-2-macroglobulin family)
MEPGKEYKGTLHLSKLMTVPAKLSTFEFNFQIIRQSFEVNVEGLRPVSNENFDRQFLKGMLTTADIADVDKVTKILTATQNDRKLPIQWQHDGLTHIFMVDSIVRGNDSSAVLLSWDGSHLDLDIDGKDTIAVPALGDFILMEASVVQQESDQYVLLQFSDPLDATQNLEGLIKLGSMSDLRFLIEANTIRVYPPSRQSSTMNLFIDSSVRNALGKKLPDYLNQNIAFEEIKPSLRLLGKGVILPGSTGLMFPFEAVNLSAVDVKIVKIFSDNISQFLQVNDLAGQNEITRVGKVVLKKSIQLSSLKQTDFTKWNQYALDLSEMIKTDPGAMYRITLSFRQKYSLYRCTDSDSVTTDAETDTDQWDDINPQQDASLWDYVEDYYEDYENYEWNNRDNPCKKEYYSTNRWISKNVLASDLGLIAKRGADGSMLFSVTDLKTTNPQAGVTLEIFNLQKQLIKKFTTNAEGIAEAKLTDKPFLMLAKKGDQRGYLKLDDGSSLSMSMFDVSGEKVQKGIKGFIYGERGVWRPGDSIYVTFLLEDKQKILPSEYPVTFELFNPLGQLSKRIVQTQSLNGFYSFHTVTNEEDITGNWEAKIKAGGATFSKSLRIETVMPNRLKIKFDFTNKYLSDDDGQSAQLETRWLHGAIAKNLKATVEVNLSASTTSFPKHSDYSFDDPTKKFNAEKQVLFEGNVDENGKVNVPVKIEVEDVAPGMLQANFVTKVFEPGGSFSIDRFNMPYHPFDTYTGISIPKGDVARGMILTDTNHVINLVSLDRNGKPITGKRKVAIEFQQLRWKWWWDKTPEEASNYNESQWERLIQRDTATITNGEGKWTLRVNYPEWGRYLLRVCDLESGHCSGKIFYMDWPGWAGRAQREQPGGGAAMLTFTSDKHKYLVGEEATLTIPTGLNSRALISIETGSRILKSDWLLPDKTESKYRFKITEDMSPNIYVHITLLQQHGQVQNDLPIRLYGIIPITVENKNTHINPVLNMPAVLKPEEEVRITVNEEKGKAMTYTLAMVDEGLLDLTRFKTPDPWNSFYAREALGVKTWDMFDHVMGSWGGKLERILSIGGDEGLQKPKDGKKANRFKPLVKFLGPFHLKKGESKTHTILLPQYIGSVRTMVIAATDDGAYGFAEKATPVRKPLMLLATLPRVLGPEEIVDIPVSVFALENHVKDVIVEIQPNEIFTPVDGKTKSIRFNQPGDEVVNFRMKVKPYTGIGKVQVIAMSGKEKAVTLIELNVMNRNPKVVEVKDTMLEAGQNWNSIYKPIGISGTNRAIIEVSTIPPLNLGKRLNYLIHYPYGCVEQTTSSVFPQLYLTDLMDLPSDKKSAIDKNVKSGIDRLRKFQVSSGGIVYWPGEKVEDDWATNYAGHFMIEAELKGYSLPAGFLDQWKKFQRNRATSWSDSKPEGVITQSYRLYTLALAKSPELGSMNRLKERTNLPVIAKWSLAAAYQIAGYPEVAEKLIANLPIIITDYKELSGTYGSDERDEAIILEALSLMEKRSQAVPLMKLLSNALCSHEWMSTQTTAYTLLAMSKFAGKTSKNSDINFTYKMNSSGEQKITAASVMKQVEIKLKGTSSGTFGIKNNGNGILYARMILEGIPSTDDQTSGQNALEMKVVYKKTNVNDFDITNINQGTDFYAEVTVTNPGLRGDYAEMALTQMFPSGWEIMNSRLDQTDNSNARSIPRYQDIRDDRVYTFFNLKAKESKTFRIYLNASYLGKYYLPAVYCEAMYDASIYSKQAGKWLNVTTQDKTPVELSKK